jgi:hypothetical protein
MSTMKPKIVYSPTHDENKLKWNPQRKKNLLTTAKDPNGCP